jgi:phage-related protein
LTLAFCLATRRRLPTRFSNPAVVEIVANHEGGTWRAIYTVRYTEAVYVLHAFQKKSKRGIATPKKDIDLIRQCLAEIERLRRNREN